MKYKVIKTRYNYVELNWTYGMEVGDEVELKGDYFYYNGEKTAIMVGSTVAIACFEQENK